MSHLPDGVIDELQTLLGPKGISTDADILASHNAEARGKFEGKAEIILFPASTEEVAKSVAISPLCRKAAIPGAVAGQLPARDRFCLISNA